MVTLGVAPPAGAWIETRPHHLNVLGQRGRPSRRGVDRNIFDADTVTLAAGRPSRRGVDRNAL